jgi:hypothetical protein
LGGRELPESPPGRQLLADAPLRAGNWNPALQEYELFVPYV